MIDYHYFFLIGSVLVAAVSQVLLKKGALHHYDSWIPVCGAVFFHEKLTARKLVGICCIVLGMAVFYL